MADNLPLIPRKETVCADVKPVLREVFREMDQLPPILDKTSATDDEKQWLEKYNLECEKIWQQEGDLKKKFAKRISKKRAPNMYSLCKADNKQDEPQEKTMIDRMDLMPSIQENATGNTNLWIRNTLQGSSTDFSYKEKPVSFKMQHPLRTVDLDEHSRQTYSVGELVAWKPRTPPVEIEPQLPEYIFCVPEQINFVNFTQGHTHTRLLKLINISKFEVRLSVSLPKRDELKIELASSRGLRITAGSASDLKIHFTPNDVRTFHDQLRIGTSMGKGLVVPIACYMEPPELHIFVQRQDTCLFTCEEFIEHTLSENKGEVMDLGAKLLGNEHFAALVLQCNEAHAAFFLLTEDAWIDWDVEELTANGSLRTGAFTIHPAWWAGGGIARGTIRCSAPEPGVHSADIRILSSTAVTRMFHVVADAVYYDPSHITITAHDKDYDINSEDDPDCEYYVDLGTTFPGLSLSATVTIVNRSPIQYSFYWNLRPWRICSCWQEHLASSSYLELEEQMSDYLCPGAQCSKDAGEKLADHVKSDASISRVRSEPAEGTVRDRGACTVRVSVANVGSRNGTHRAVLQLILKDIPIESFQPGYVPNTVCKRVVKECGLNGKIFYRIVCDIVQAQMEVWWNVVPVRFVLDPPVLPLFHSRRVKSVEVSLCATQLYGVDHIATSWSSSAAMALPDHSHLSPESSIWAKMIVPLPSLPNTYPGTDIITLKADNYEWSANCHITRACTSRYPRITPPRHWLGVVVPGAHVTANIEVRNTTYQNICWWATPYRWTGENPPNTACAQAERTCSVCCERACTCSLIRPARGCLAEDQRSNIGYNVYAPTTDRIVATLVKVVRTEPDTAQVPGRPGCEARATLLAYRVLAPRLVMQVFPCDGNKKGHCKYKHFQGGVCDLDIGENSQGSAVLRPTKALSPCGRSCYKLRITNTTPIATSVKWEPPVDGEQFLKVKFLPNQFQIGRYNERIISVILEPRRMCERRLFVLRAQVAHAYKPLYLIIDTAIDGVRIICEVPLGGAERNDSFIALRRSQKELTPEEESRLPTSSEECFKAEDRKRAVVQENICDCKFELQYIPPVKPLRPPEATPSPTEILTSPPSLTRVCECFDKTKPVLPQHKEPCCLQFRCLPVNTVKSRRLTFRNEGKVTAKWRMVVRYFPRQRNHAATIEALAVGGDRWAGDVLPPGVVIQCVPAKGICTAGQSIDIQVQVYADSWGLYFDQIMLMVDHVEPIVVDVWIEAVGPVLQFATASKSADQEFDSTMWLSTSDPDRMLRVKNISRSRLTVHAFMLLEHEHHQDSWPLRLYMEFTDVPKPTCPCVTYFSSDTSDVNNEASTHTVKEKMDTGFELYLAKDHGLQDNEYYTVEPKKCSSEPGEWMEWQVSLKPKYRGEIAPPGIVMLRTVPIDDRGDHWARWEPEPRRVGVREAPRAPSLRLSCKEVRVRLCALELDYNEVARVRKRFHMRNIGTAPLLVDCQTERPWQIVLNKPQNTCGDCGCIHELGDRTHQVQMNVEPWSSTAMCVEVSVYTVDFWPAVADEVDAVDKKCVLISYPSKQESVSHMTFTCNQEVLDKVTLILEVDFPQLFLEPEVIDFGFVTHGDTRKTYFSVWHSSLTATIDLGLTWHGSAKLRLYPRHFRVAPGERKRVYVQYNAVWTGAPIPVEGCIKVSAHAGAGAWCRCAMYVRAQPARDAKFHREVHDHTDMMTLWPPELPRL